MVILHDSIIIIFFYFILYYYYTFNVKIEIICVLIDLTNAKYTVAYYYNLIKYRSHIQIIITRTFYWKYIILLLLFPKGFVFVLNNYLRVF